MKIYIKNAMKWLATTKILAFPRKFVKKGILSAIDSVNGDVYYYETPEKLDKVVLSVDHEIVKKVSSIKKEVDLCLSCICVEKLLMAIKSTSKIDGDIAEVGVYRGGSAKLICEAKENKTLHLFDTFEGLPELSQLDDPNIFHKGQLISSLEDVKNYLKTYPNVYFYKGIFPSTASSLVNKKFSFVHLDVDLYNSTISCLEFFYSRMSKGGIILSHDYLISGVKKAFDEFLENKPEPIIQISSDQCLIVKC